ncbi:anticodon binding domain of tRNAs-domain-containing protein [Calycina marina]|uniref:non-specific serine/threonine protein kinase n=1 Tax=Calycina marina TaxID=1763456 RepID=A0A9P7ZA86_9HELO|nr:anticodon binding domain of tRNAs-domain-containing protein [Calycina marina]
MAPASPWRKKTQPETSSTRYPGLKTGQPKKEAAPKSRYEEIQEDELIALSSIYGDDFRHVEKKQTAWQKTEPSFEIRIKSSDDDIAVTLAATFTATYPKTVPLLSLKDGATLQESTKFKLQKIIETKPRELLAVEEAMVMEVVNACQDVLEDTAQAKAAGKEVLSLEEERAAHEAAALEIAEQQRKEDEERRALENMEDDRVLEHAVQAERERRKAKTKETKRKNQPPSLSDIPTPMTASHNSGADDYLAFDQPIELDSDSPLTFQAVTRKALISKGFISKCFTVVPFVTQTSLEDLPSLALKQSNVAIETKNNNGFKKQLQDLETELEKLKKFRHRNILNLYDFKVHKPCTGEGEADSSWTVSILTEYAEKGSLGDFLDIIGDLGVVKVRSWTIDLLDALKFLHEKGIQHGDIHANNVLLVRDNSGAFRLKLADAGYQRKLHSLAGKRLAKNTLSLAKSAYWVPPENANADSPVYTQKTDVWDFGVLFLQMAFGMSAIQNYASPSVLVNSHALSDSLHEFVNKLFKADPRKRPRAFELGSSEFLATDALIFDNDLVAEYSRNGSTATLMPVTPRQRQRQDSLTSGGPFSRYAEDFVEESRLGKGGFGEVVKARKKLDGQIYAIKKITQKSSASLTEVLKEVRLLSQISHPSVVRYYNTWTEEIFDVGEADDDTTTVTTDATTTEDGIVSNLSPCTDLDIEAGVSTGGLDFMSSNGYPQIEFGFSDGSDVDNDEEEDSMDGEESAAAESVVPAPDNGGNNIVLPRIRSGSRYQRTSKTILYISMEYCEKRTLRDLIKRTLHKDNEDIWRLFRQVLEGLVHIHSLHVVHRDLKPENIFIDAASNVRIGDFGLATSGHYSFIDKNVSAAMHTSGDMTKSIGTAAYVAPEVKSSVGGTYTSKVDMYSLGVIFFEMCYRSIVGMERAQVVEALRGKKPTLPLDFDATGKPVQADIILSLLNHNPKERPASSELLHGGKLPVQMESETIRQTLAGLADPHSPYYREMMSALFSQPTKLAKDVAWDMDVLNPSADDLLLQGLVKQKLVSIFRRHGAVETPRSALFPRSGHYGSNAVQLLDPNGNIVQLPFDLTLPHARAIAKHAPSVQRSFAFGTIFRDKLSGGQPQALGEVDFDIVTSDSLDLAMKDAEVIKVLDEVITSFPALMSTPMCFHLNHADLLDLVLDWCRVQSNLRPVVTDTLSKLNHRQWTWQKIKGELRSPHIGLSATSIDDLERFDFRDTLTKTCQRLEAIFESSGNYDKASPAIAHLKDVIRYTNHYGIKSKLYVAPLVSLQEKFCKGGMIFSCMYDHRIKEVFAAGGRYDSLVREFGHKIGHQMAGQHAVGFNLAWEKLARLPKSGAKGFLKKQEEELHAMWTTRRCDVLIASHDPVILRTAGPEIVQQLWANDISAELAQDSQSPEELLARYREEHHSWIVTIKQDSMLKIKTMRNKDALDADRESSSLVSWLLGEMRERDQKDNTVQRARLQRNYSQNDAPNEINHEQNVQVLLAGHRSKKSNRGKIVEQAQARAATLAQSFLDGPIAAIETSDEAMELLRDTRLSDPDSWRKVSHAVPTTERRYVGEIHDLMSELAQQNKDNTRNAFIYNFRTQMCIYYDLGA